MIDRILRDSELRPDPFFWTGKPSLVEIEEWERAESISLPQDLKRLWNIKGGGELFETETILTPLPPSNEDDPVLPRYEEDLVLPRSRWFWGKGLDWDCYVFHEGSCVSAFRESDHSLCSLKSEDFSQVGVFRTLDDWYLSTLRAEYFERYGLPRL